ncbi:hypothetical protein HDU97_009997 [Phlyctochytrium planicorne]|nr:hypothetical protein HDU97_009997 [Phlyctochytrium planicorne]
MSANITGIVNAVPSTAPIVAINGNGTAVIKSQSPPQPPQLQFQQQQQQQVSSVSGLPVVKVAPSPTIDSPLNQDSRNGIPRYTVKATATSIYEGVGASATTPVRVATAVIGIVALILSILALALCMTRRVKGKHPASDVEQVPSEGRRALNRRSLFGGWGSARDTQRHGQGISQSIRTNNVTAEVVKADPGVQKPKNASVLQSSVLNDNESEHGTIRGRDVYHPR